MKKITLLIFTGFLLLAMIFTNPSENDFVQKIENSKDPLSEFYTPRLMKTVPAIYESEKNYFSPIFNLKYTNLGIFSIANLEYGWMGTVNFAGEPLGEYVNKEFRDSYLMIFGNSIKISK